MSRCWALVFAALSCCASSANHQHLAFLDGFLEHLYSVPCLAGETEQTNGSRAASPPARCGPFVISLFRLFRGRLPHIKISALKRRYFRPESSSTGKQWIQGQPFFGRQQSKKWPFPSSLLFINAATESELSLYLSLRAPGRPFPVFVLFSVGGCGMPPDGSVFFARGRVGETDMGELDHFVFLGDIGRLRDRRRGRDLVRIREWRCYCCVDKQEYQPNLFLKRHAR